MASQWAFTALAVVTLAAVCPAQEIDDAAKAEAWFADAVQAHPDLADDHDALVKRMGGTAAAYQSMALIEEMRGNAGKSLEYLRIAIQVDPNSADAAFYYAMALRNVDPPEYRKLAETLAVRFPGHERAAQAIYRLGLDTPLLDERIDLLEHYRPALAKANSSKLTTELLLDAYIQTDLDRASAFEYFDPDSSAYVRRLVAVRDVLCQATPKGNLMALRGLEDLQAEGLPPRMSHTPFYLMQAAAQHEKGGYASLTVAMAREPSDTLRDAWQRYGAKLGKTPREMQADVRAALTAHAPQAAPFTLPGFDGAKVSLADYRGKVVIVNYWHPSCSQCRDEAPFLQQSLRKFGSRQVAVLSVNVRAAEDSYVLPFIHGNGYYFTPLHSDAAGKRDTPESLLVDQDGRLVYRRGAIRGAADQRELELQIETLLSPANVRTDTREH
jgi:peroxiredoxin